jgi:hypothetical protein
MLRVLLLVSSLLALTVGVSSAAVVFYNDQALWNAANTATASDNFNSVNFSGVASGPYLTTAGVQVSSPYVNVGVDVNTQTGRNIVTGAGSGDTGIANGPTQVWERDFSTGRYLLTGGQSAFDIAGLRQWGREEQQWNSTTGQWEVVKDNSYTSYAGGAQTTDLELAIPAGFSSVSFDLGLASGFGDRTLTAVVNTFLGETATFNVQNAFGTLSFFGFQAAAGDTISSIRLSSLLLPVPDATRPNWSYDAGNTYRTRVWNLTNQSFYDQYQLGLDNLVVGNASGGPPPPPPPDGGGGETPEPSTLLTLAGGLLLLARFRRGITPVR